MTPDESRISRKDCSFPLSEKLAGPWVLKKLEPHLGLKASEGGSEGQSGGDGDCLPP